MQLARSIQIQPILRANGNRWLFEAAAPSMLGKDSQATAAYYAAAELLAFAPQARVVAKARSSCR